MSYAPTHQQHTGVPTAIVPSNGESPSAAAAPAPNTIPGQTYAPYSPTAVARPQHSDVSAIQEIEVPARLQHQVRGAEHADDAKGVAL